MHKLLLVNRKSSVMINYLQQVSLLKSNVNIKNHLLAVKDVDCNPPVPDTYLLNKVVTIYLSVHSSCRVIPIELLLGHLPSRPRPLSRGLCDSGLFAPRASHQLIREVLFKVEHVEVGETIYWNKWKLLISCIEYTKQQKELRKNNVNL